METAQEIVIRPVAPVDQAAALWLLFSRDPLPQRRDRVAAVLRGAAQRSLDLELLLEAVVGKERHGVIWGQRMPGHHANVWPAATIAGAAGDVEDLLLARLDALLIDRRLTMAQALIGSNQLEVGESLRRCQYEHAATLLYLVAVRDQFPTEEPSGAVQFEPYREVDAERVAAVVAQTYQDSQDAPALDGWRDVQDVMAGYRGTGQFAPERWFLVREDDHDVGCLLLTDHPELRHWELMYMGLLPRARGRGWGRDIVRFAQWQTGQAGRDALLITVDSGNGPAVTTYARCGFEEFERREVWVKNFRS